MNECECGPDVAQTLTTGQVLFTRSQSYLEFTSQDMSVDRAIFEFLLRQVEFVHDTTRPSTNQYSALVRVSVSDGVFTSVDSFTHVTVTVDNQPPRLTINGQDTQTLTLLDGMDIYDFVPRGVVQILEDSNTISSISIELTNPQHSEERLLLNTVSLPDTISGSVSEDGLTITLTGPASPMEFAQVLLDNGGRPNPLLQYNYPPLSSILQGDVPDFTQR